MYDRSKLSELIRFAHAGSCLKMDGPDSPFRSTAAIWPMLPKRGPVRATWRRGRVFAERQRHRTVAARDHFRRLAQGACRDAGRRAPRRQRDLQPLLCRLHP